MAHIEPKQLLEAVEKWVTRKQRRDPPSIHGCSFVPFRLSYVYQRLNQELNTNYFGLGDPSPIKDAACYCCALATEKLLVFKAEDGARDEELLSLRRRTALTNAEMALDLGLVFVRWSKFTIRPHLVIPFSGAIWPSNHMRREALVALASGRMTTPGLALLFEAILYRDPRADRDLRGALD
jgi:hypothetical protein